MFLIAALAVSLPAQMSVEGFALLVALGSLALQIWNRLDTRRQQRQRDYIFIEPVRFESTGQKALFRVSTGSPVRKVKFQFIKNNTGGTITREMVAAGEVSFRHGDFAVSEPTTLVQPEGLEAVAATACWRRKEKGRWETCGIYITTSNSELFRPLAAVKSERHPGL